MRNIQQKKGHDQQGKENKRKLIKNNKTYLIKVKLNIQTKMFLPNKNLKENLNNHLHQKNNKENVRNLPLNKRLLMN